MTQELVDHRLQVGDRAPVIALPDASGNVVEIVPADSAATAVVFTSNGCPYALAWHDRIQDVARDYADRGVQVVQIVPNDAELQPLDSPAAMAARVERGEVAGTFLRDDDQTVARAFGATATPDVYVIDRHGVVRYHGAPDADYDDPAQRAIWLRDAIEDLLADKDVTRPSTSPAGCSVKWRLDLQWWAGCPSHDRAREMVLEVLDRMGRHDVRVQPVEVTSPAQAAALDFVGSPSFVIGGADLFADRGAPTALTCRTYRLEDGRFSPLPSIEELEKRMRAALVRPWELPGWVDFRKQQ
ncbi:thioredoxin family protein [Nocardioides panacihumi]